MEFRKLNATVTIFNKYVENREVKYKRILVNHCKFVGKKAVVLGNTMVKDSDTGKLFVYFKDLPMNEYKKPNQFVGDGFTIANGDIVVIGNAPEITSIKDLGMFEHYTINSVIKNDYSIVLPHHFSIEVK